MDIEGGLMKHNERARVAPKDFFKGPLRAQKKRNAHTTRTPTGLVFGLLARCGRPFLGSLAPLVLILVLAL